jgi:intein/homing endonuclease
LKEFQTLIWDECFSGDTLVLLKDLTWKKISEINIGDEVISMNSIGEFESKKVLELHINLPKSSGKMLRLHFDNSQYVDVTEDHEFYTISGKKIKAADLTYQDEISEFSINKLKIHGGITHEEERDK